MYDPHEHAADLGLTIATYPVRTGNAFLIPEKRLILVRPRLRAAFERGVIAHEIVHYEYMDAGRAQWQEDRADRIAAQRLVDPHALARAERMYEHPQNIADELGVPTWIITAWRAAA